MSNATEMLLAFIGAAKAKGASDESLVNILKQAGWSEGEMNAALGRYYENATGMELPRRTQISSNRAQDGLLYLILYITLAIWTIGVGSVFFTLIARAFPAAGEMLGPETLRDQLSWALGNIIITFPIYMLTSYYVQRQLKAHPEKWHSGVRRWLTAVMLVLAAATAIGDLTTFVAYLLRGGITIRFILETVVVLVISGGVFLYYLSFLKSKAAVEMNA